MTNNKESFTVSQLEIDLAEVSIRNTERLNKAKEQLGTKWLLHPSNHITRKSTKDNK